MIMPPLFFLSFGFVIMSSIGAIYRFFTFNVLVGDGDFGSLSLITKFKIYAILSPIPPSSASTKSSGLC